MVYEPGQRFEILREFGALTVTRSSSSIHGSIHNVSMLVPQTGFANSDSKCDIVAAQHHRKTKAVLQSRYRRSIGHVFKWEGTKWLNLRGLEEGLKKERKKERRGKKVGTRAAFELVSFLTGYAESGMVLW